MPQSFGALFCHLVFSTKGREPTIGPEFEGRLYEYVGGLLRARKAVLLASGGMPDHAHLLLSMGRDWAVSDLVRDVKANSSGWVHETITGLEHFAWQIGYGAFSVSKSQLGVVERYINGQKAHHADRSYQDEFRGLLSRHGLECDEAHAWD